MKFYNMKNIFTNHPNSIGETYFQHFLKSMSFGIKLIFIGFRAFIHAVLPWCYEYSVSDYVYKLNQTLQNRKKTVNK